MFIFVKVLAAGLALVLAVLLAVVDAGRRGSGRWRWNSPPRGLMQLMQIIRPELGA